MPLVANNGPAVPTSSGTRQRLETVEPVFAQNTRSATPEMAAEYERIRRLLTPGAGQERGTHRR
ncbi:MULTISPECIES: hypothetical protein [Streptomyces]|uniref:Uncharacterized protein n=1 Tax=Streptomyces demainii TaxID=588122 RepID=A0ABT9KNY8_9ACTN|nr:MULTISPECIES: hypothetical protein [Streptomyces]MCO8306209.1 hypothetical protein [Streptomyces sp. RKCA744]MDP9610155.1 hypothetical protein [Streptomyces demainii]